MAALITGASFSKPNKKIPTFGQAAVFKGVTEQRRLQMKDTSNCGSQIQNLLDDLSQP